jgi:hypothetical protein
MKRLKEKEKELKEREALIKKEEVFLKMSQFGPSCEEADLTLPLSDVSHHMQEDSLVNFSHILSKSRDKPQGKHIQIKSFLN